MVISKDYDTIEFLSNYDGVFETVAKFDINYHVRDVAVTGNVVAVGSPLENSNTGAVYIFERDSLGEWSYIVIVPDDHHRPGVEFGSAVGVLFQACIWVTKLTIFMTFSNNSSWF